MTTVETVRGPVDTATLGRTLMHEHIVWGNPEIRRDHPEVFWGEDPDATIRWIIGQLQKVVASGISTVLDVTVMGQGRDMEALQRINAEVELNIITATGIYTNDALPQFYQVHQPKDPEDRDVLTEILVRDITRGIGGTSIKAGVIKCVTDAPGVTPNVDRILRAVAAAHRETGVPITTHSHGANGLDQQRVFAQLGVDLTRVIIGHAGDSQDFDYLRRLMDAGSTIGADRFGQYWPGEPTLDQRVDVVARLCEQGYADRIVLSHDRPLYTDWFDPWDPSLPAEWVQTHVPDDVVPALRERGVTEDQIDLMLIGNPRRIFEAQGSY